MGGHPSHSHQGGINYGNAATTLRAEQGQVLAPRQFLPWKILFFRDTLYIERSGRWPSLRKNEQFYLAISSTTLSGCIFRTLQVFLPSKGKTLLSLKRLPEKWCKYKRMSKLSQFFFSSILRLYFQNEKCRRRKGVECENISMKKVRQLAHERKSMADFTETDQEHSSLSLKRWKRNFWQHI